MVGWEWLEGGEGGRGGEYLRQLTGKVTPINIFFLSVLITTLH